MHLNSHSICTTLHFQLSLRWYVSDGCLLPLSQKMPLVILALLSDADCAGLLIWFSWRITIGRSFSPIPHFLTLNFPGVSTPQVNLGWTSFQLIGLPQPIVLGFPVYMKPKIHHFHRRVLQGWIRPLPMNHHNSIVLCKRAQRIRCFKKNNGFNYFIEKNNKICFF